MWGVILALQTSRAVHLGVDNLGVVRHVGRLLDGSRGNIPFELVNDGDLLLLIERMLHRRGLDTVRISYSRVMLMRTWFFMVGFGGRISLEMTLLMRLLILDVGELVLLTLMLVVICLGFVIVGTLFSLTFIVFSLLFLELWSIMMVEAVLLLILQYGLLVLVPRGVGWFMLFGIGCFCPGRLVYGIRNGLVFLHPLSVLRILHIGPLLLVSWLSGSLS